MTNKRWIKGLSALSAALLLLLGIPWTAAGEQATSYTYTLDDKGDFIRTQDAYLPNRTLTELGLSSASDLFIGRFQTSTLQNSMLMVIMNIMILMD